MRNLLFTIMLVYFCFTATSAQKTEKQYKLAFVTFTIDNAHGVARQAIYIMNLDGTNRFPLTDIMDGIETNPNWSGDGASIIFASNRSASPKNTLFDATNTLAKSQIYVARLGNPIPTLLTRFESNPNYDNGAFFPTLSPNGQFIAFRHQQSLFLMHSDGTELHHLQEFAAAFTWSEDSCCLAFDWAVQGGSKPEIGTISLETEKTLNISNYPDIDITPDWSPDGKHLVFASYRRGSSDIYRVDKNGENLIQLSDNPTDDEVSPSWSPNGKWIAYIESNTGNLILINPIGELLTRLDLSLSPPAYLTWLPDSTGLLFYGWGYDEARSKNYQVIQLFYTTCLNPESLCSTEDIISIPETHTEQAISSFAISPLKLPSD